MSFQKRKHETKLAFALVGLAFFTVTSAYVLVKLDASLNRPRAEPIAREEKTEIRLASPATSISPVSTTSFDSPAAETAIEIDEQMWRNAEAALRKYFEEINAGNYAEATAIRTREFLVGSAETYAARLQESMDNEISGKIEISDFERVESESKLTTKVFRFRKSAVWTFDRETHGELKKAFLVLRNGEWKIDYFDVEKRF
ncbi:hypothetical protein KKF38_01540 [Patescibacteria group bacterium]|nr:hypothetical protein [Patescibacteria group bacterium]